MRNIVDQESALLALFKYKFRVILPLLVVNNGVFLPFGGESDVCFVVTYLETATVMALGGLAVLMSSDCGLKGGRERGIGFLDAAKNILDHFEKGEN